MRRATAKRYKTQQKKRRNAIRGEASLHSRSRGPGSWWKCISSSREIHTAMGSFDCVRLAPHCPQDDRELELGRVDTFQKRIVSGGPMRAMPMYGFPLRGGNAYLVLVRSTQQGGLSTPFGWRLTALKVTGNQKFLRAAFSDRCHCGAVPFTTRASGISSPEDKCTCVVKMT